MSQAVDLLFERLRRRGDAPVLWASGREIPARELLARADALEHALREQGIGPGTVAGFAGDYGLATVATFLALFRLGAIAVPFSPSAVAERDSLAREAQIEAWIDPEAGTVTRLRQEPAAHPLIAQLRRDAHAGLIVFTSGSSGKPKAILHDLERVASKFVQERRGWRMVLFLLMDHFGGFNTLLACLSHGGVGICTEGRTPDAVCAAIASARAELLPTTPTFLSLLIASGAAQRHDLSSIRLVTYGAEPMPEGTLRQLPQLFPNAEFKQTYGLSELGVLHSASPDSRSLFLRMGGEGFETRVVEGTLRIRSRSSMLGYLNAPSPIDAEGWMDTGDLVEEKDGLLRVIGRVSDVINVGGQKVFPVEVESVLREHPQVAEATVYGLPHPVLGQAVAARISLADGADGERAVAELRSFCKGRLQKYKVPMRFDLVGLDEHGNERGKKTRR